MRVRVIRGSGDRQAANIVDPLCTTNAVGVQRGRNILDRDGFDKTGYDVELPYRQMPVTGSIVEISDSLTGETFRGKLEGFKITVTAPNQNNTTPLKVRISASLERSRIR